MKHFCFFLEIDALEANFAYETFPLHCTILPFVETSGSVEWWKVTGFAKNICSASQPLLLTSEAPALFGKDKNIPVHTVKRTPELQALHIALSDMMAQENASPLEPQWHRDGFSPHVTNKGQEQFGPGQTFTAGRLALIEKDPVQGGKLVRARIFIPDGRVETGRH